MKKQVVAIFLSILMLLSYNGTVVFAADSEKPVINTNTIILDKIAASEGDIVTISVKVTDNVAVSRVNISLNNQETGKLSWYNDMTYNSQTGLYEYKFNITSETPSGHWYISEIQAYDAVSNCDVKSFGSTGYVFMVTTSADSEKPVIDTNTITLDKTAVSEGDTVTIGVKVTDNVAVSKVNISLNNQETGKLSWYNDMTYNSQTGLYEYKFNVTSETPTGHWYISEIQAYDAVSNCDVKSFGSTGYVLVVSTPAVRLFYITFNSNGGSYVANQSVNYNAEVLKPDDPIRLGYTFSGWYKEPECINAWNFATDKVTADTTLYANWTNNNMDINNDGVIDIHDVAELASHYNNKIGQTNWNFKYDLNKDGIVDIYDLVLVSKYINTILN